MPLRAGLLLCTIAMTLACASLSPEPPSCRRLAEARAPAARFREQAEATIDAKDPEGAYDCLVLMWETHPDNPETREAFRLAAALLQRQYFASRFADPDARWVTSEPERMYRWLLSYFGDEFPQREAEALFRGMPYPFFQSFASFARSAPEARGWQVRASDDNGIIESVSAEAAR